MTQKNASETTAQETKGENTFSIQSLGPCKYPSPYKYSPQAGRQLVNYIKDSDKVLYKVRINEESDSSEVCAALTGASNRMEKAGPRENIFFDPRNVKAGIVTCGGLCPGLNDVIRSLVRSLMIGYGVTTVWGFRYGYLGLLLDAPMGPMKLDPDLVDDIHTEGGSILGSARGGGEQTGEIVDTLQRYGINVFFVVGGDGSQRGAQKIAEEAERRKYTLVVVGVPKTIDNDLSFIHKSFGFETAVGLAYKAVEAAHVEAKCAYNGVGLVRVMGRDAGFIAAQTALASQAANFVLIPEIPFDLDGANGLFAHLEARLRRKQHAVIVVAEGAGSALMAKELGELNEYDAGGNKKHHDIGIFLKEKLTDYFRRIEMSTTIRYIDPSYMIRAGAPNSNDALYCARLGAMAVHAAMAGKNKVMVSMWNNTYTHVPIAAATKKRNSLNPDSSLWRDVIECTFQPISMKN